MNIAKHCAATTMKIGLSCDNSKRKKNEILTN